MRSFKRFLVLGRVILIAESTAAGLAFLLLAAAVLIDCQLVPWAMSFDCFTGIRGFVAGYLPERVTDAWLSDARGMVFFVFAASMFMSAFNLSVVWLARAKLFGGRRG